MIKYCKGFLNLYHIHFIGKMYFDDSISVDPLIEVEMTLLADDGVMQVKDGRVFDEATHHVRLISELEYSVMKALSVLMQKTFAKDYIEPKENEPTEIESLDSLMKYLKKYKKELKDDDKQR